MPKGSGKASPKVAVKRELPADNGEALLETLKDRFEHNMHRHKGLKWAEVRAKLEADAEKLKSLHAMEQTGGEPDVVGFDKKTGEFIFYDCSAQSPDRRSICYDREGQQERERRSPSR
jgi:hypothetical protein